jgi:membrane protease YdiL (CAAX protease family)
MITRRFIMPRYWVSEEECSLEISTLSEMNQKMATTVQKKTKRMLIMFFVLAYAIIWALLLPILLFPQRADQLDFLLLIAAYAPFLAAIITTIIYDGRAGLWNWLKSVFKWRIPFIWYLVGGVLINFLFVALHIGLYLLLGGRILLANGDIPWYGYLAIFPVAVFLSFPFGSGLGEEAGWRGFALPKLLERYSPVTASIILGVLWGLWHTPALLMSSWEGSSQGLLLFVYVIPLTIIMTWVYLKSHRSTIPLMLMHTGGNFYGSMLSSSLVMETVLVDSPGLDFTILKTIYYTVVAVVLLIITKGRLGYSGEEETIPLTPRRNTDPLKSRAQVINEFGCEP